VVTLSAPHGAPRVVAHHEDNRSSIAVVRCYAEFVGAQQQGEFSSAAEALTSPVTLQGLRRLRAVIDPRTTLRVAVAVELREQGDRITSLMVGQLAHAQRLLSMMDIGLDVWPMLADHPARYLNGATASEYQRLLMPLLATLDDHAQVRRSAHQLGVCIDVEPHAEQLHLAWQWSRSTWRQRLSMAAKMGLGAVRTARLLQQGSRDMAELLRDLDAHGIPVHTAIPPPAIDGIDAIYDRLLSCRLFDDEGHCLFPDAAALCYPRLWHSHDDDKEHHRTFALWATRHRQRSDAVVVGVLSTGIMGDEPVIPTLDALMEDLRVVRTLGYRDVAIYSLEGLLFGSAGRPSAGLRADLNSWCDGVGAGLAITPLGRFATQ
jgi:hypothetical protein